MVIPTQRVLRATIVSFAALFAVASSHAQNKTLHGYCYGTKFAGEVTASWVSQQFRIPVTGKLPTESTDASGVTSIWSRGPVIDEILSVWVDTSGCNSEDYCKCRVGIEGPRDTYAGMEDLRRIALSPQTLSGSSIGLRKDITIVPHVMDIPLDALKLAVEKAKSKPFDPNKY